MTISSSSMNHRLKRPRDPRLPVELGTSIRVMNAKRPMPGGR
jgi:hypothetical protein